MKIGIALTGEIYGKNTGEHKATQRNWLLTKDNIKANLIDAYKKNHDVSVYVTTYQQPTLEELIEFYAPTKQLILPYENSHQRTTYIKSMQNLLDQDLDFIIATRFDLSFCHEVPTFNWDHDKMNLACRELNWIEKRYINDCLFGFPKRYLESFIRCIEKEHANPYTQWAFMHAIYRYMIEDIPEQDINFLIEGHQHSCWVPNLYNMIRGNFD